MVITEQALTKAERRSKGGVGEGEDVKKEKLVGDTVTVQVTVEEKSSGDKQYMALLERVRIDV